MAILKCKMCGGDIEVTADKQFGICDSCGSTMTFPKIDDERRANGFNRANHFRRLNEFDKAIGAYEQLLSEDDQDAEAHWGVVLSRFGVEYVEDPGTHEHIPTVHRVQSASVLTDPDYLSALEYASDGYTRSLYEQEAHQISEIQKRILAVSASEKPYDVFICYKETTDGGSRSRDSALAQDIYYQLEKEGHRVFFARISLEDKLGKAYEPYIFAALQSAKVMLVVGTKPEYFNAVWVKNEWGRYLSLMKADRSKLLIPCYQDMDAYDLPDELSMLQSQDMGKIGFMQDILRGVGKVLGADVEPAIQVMPPVSAIAAPGVESLYKRACLFLEDGEFEAAKEYFNKVLDIDPEYAPAYIGALCVSLNCKQESELTGRFKYQECADEAAMIFSRCYIDELNSFSERLRQISSGQEMAPFFTGEANFKKALRFADDNSKVIYQSYATAAENKSRSLLQKLIEETSIVLEKNIREREEGRRLLESLRPKLEKFETCFSASEHHSVALRANGTVVATGRNAENQCDVSDWRDIIAVSTSPHRTLGVRADGAIIVAGIHQFDEALWNGHNIVGVSAGPNHLAGFTAKSGTIIEWYDDSGYKIDGWRNLAKVSFGSKHIVGLKKDGTVVATGNNQHDQCNVYNWRSIVAISAGNDHTVGLMVDGTVLAVGDNEHGQCDTYGWRNIVAISAGTRYTIGLKADGTVVAVGVNARGNCDVGEWRNIVAVSAGGSHTIGLRADGTLVAAGDNGSGQCDVDSWSGIAPFSAESARLFAEQEWQNQVAEWQTAGLCRFCGGTIYGVFGKKCNVCYKKQ